MPINDREKDAGGRSGVTTLLERAAAAAVRAEDRLCGAIEDVFLADDARLDDRTRLGMTRLLAQLTGAVEATLRRQAARLLIARDEAALADRVSAPAPPIIGRLIASGLLRDPEVMRELLGRIRQDAIADALPTSAPDDPERSSLLPRLLHHANPAVGAGAAALLAAESRRRLSGPDGTSSSSDLPAELQHRLVWWSAAAVRPDLPDAAGATTSALDRALAEAAQHVIAAHHERDRLEAVALQLAVALDPTPADRARLLMEALLDRRLSLCIALIAQGLGLDYADTREIVLDPSGDRLWLTLRAIDLDRATIARFGLSLAEADPRRDIDGFADTLDDIAEIDCVAARHALAPLLLHRDYRAALTAFARGTRRTSAVRGAPA